MMKRRARIENQGIEARRQVAGLRLASYLPFLIGQVYLRRARMLDSALKPLKFTEHEWRILVVLSDNDGCTMSEMAEWTVLDRSTMSRTLTGLEKRRLLRRRLSDNDRRVTEIQMTKSGWNSFCSVISTVEAVSEKMLAGLDERDLDQVKRSLRKLMLNLGGGDLL